VAGREDPAIARLMDRFVCVRLVQAWGLELDAFLSDPRLTFGIVFLNAEGAVYGRYTGRQAEDLPALPAALEGALALHAKWPSNRGDLEGKKAQGLPWRRTSDVPSLREKFGPAGLRGSGCLHCHDVRPGVVRSLEQAGTPVPQRLATPYPDPGRIGLTLAPGERATVREVQKGGLAETAGLKAGDRLRRLGGQPLISIADVAWALYAGPDEGDLAVDLERDGAPLALRIRLPKAWRNP
jgi:serine protease Do